MAGIDIQPGLIVAGKFRSDERLLFMANAAERAFLTRRGYSVTYSVGWLTSGGDRYVNHRIAFGPISISYTARYSKYGTRLPAAPSGGDVGLGF